MRSPRSLATALLLALVACGNASPPDVDAAQGSSAALTASAFPSLRFRQGAVLYYDYSDLVIRAGRGGYGVTFKMELAVRQDAYDKSVGIVWTADAWRTARVCDLAYEGMLDGGMERWGGPCSSGDVTPNEIQLAAFATMNGTTSWDNNGGSNYRIAFDSRVGWSPSPAQGLAVAASVERPHTPLNFNDTPALFGSVVVWDYPGAKSVTVVYTTDGWATTHTSDAGPGPSPYGAWAFLIPLPADADRVEYAVRYRVAGVDFWANNGGKNYVSAVPKSAP